MDKKGYKPNDIDYSSDEQTKLGEILRLLEEHYSNATTELNFDNPFELLIATILAAQCTDRQVNKVTPGLFSKYPGPEDFAVLSPEELGKEIYSCGFYKTKSRNIIETCRLLLAKHGGQVPNDMESLTSLPGVGRKTANVILGNAFNIPAFPVDTHVFRVSHRLGLSLKKTPEKVEADLCQVFLKKDWIKTHHQLILHGRTLCKAQNPLCNKCPLNAYCQFYFEGKSI